MTGAGSRIVGPGRLPDGRGVRSLGKRRDVAEHPGVVLVHAEEMSAARTAVVPERVRISLTRWKAPLFLHAGHCWTSAMTFGQPSSFLESPGGIRDSWSGLREFHDIPRPWRPASGKCCDVVEQMGELLMHAPEVTAITAEICTASEFARETTGSGPAHRRTPDT